MNALIAVVAVATVLTPALSARPLLAVVAGLPATFAWVVAFAVAFPQSWLLAAAFLGLAGACGYYTAEAAFAVSAAERALDADERTEGVR